MSIDTPAVLVEGESAISVTRPPCTFLEVPSPAGLGPRDATGPDAADAVISEHTTYAGATDADVAGRRGRALAILAEHPELRIAAFAEAGDPAHVTVAIRVTPETAMSVMGAQQLNSGLISILRAVGMPDGVGQ